jgi:hypothetical protein
VVADSSALRAFAAGRLFGVAPYLVRTRFERILFGMVTDVSLDAYGTSPSGMTSDHLVRFLSSHSYSVDGVDEILWRIVRLFDKFTYLCDSSNWSNDGQDPRLEMCREDIAAVCRLIDERPHRFST